MLTETKDEILAFLEGVDELLNVLQAEQLLLCDYDSLKLKKATAKLREKLTEGHW